MSGNELLMFNPMIPISVNVGCLGVVLSGNPTWTSFGVLRAKCDSKVSSFSRLCRAGVRTVYLVCFYRVLFVRVVSNVILSF